MISNLYILIIILIPVLGFPGDDAIAISQIPGHGHDLPTPTFDKKTESSLDTSKLRIVGGVQAGPTEFPSMVLIKAYEVPPRPSFFSILNLGMGQMKKLCGGTLIDSQWILTAAHCATKEPALYAVQAGVVHLNLPLFLEKQERSIARIVRHSEYNPDTGDYDIALMKVSPPFLPDSFIAPISRAQVGLQPTGSATVTGFGHFMFDDHSNGASSLYKANVPIVPNDQCQQFYGDKYMITPRMLCAGQAGQGFCRGDSGGPLYCPGGVNGSNILCGIVSSGAGCASTNIPGIYTRITSFNDWINMSINN